MTYIAIMLQKNTKEYKDIINEQLKIFGVRFLRNIIEANKKIPKASGTSASSFKIDVIKAGTKQLAQLILQFDQAPRFYDMKYLEWNKQIPFNAIQSWIEDKGVQKFKSKFKRIHGKLPTSDTKLMNQIAWGIVKKKTKRKRKIKWYSKNYYKNMYGFYYALIEILQQYHIEQMKQKLES